MNSILYRDRASSEDSERQGDQPIRVWEELIFDDQLVHSCDVVNNLVGDANRCIDILLEIDSILYPRTEPCLDAAELFDFFQCLYRQLVKCV